MPRMGRPKKQFDWETLNKILQYRPSQSDCADILNISEDSISRRIREEFNLTFAEYRNKKMSKLRLNLSQKAVQMALSGNVTMMIFCLKNYCGWKDNPEINDAFISTIKIDSGDEGL